MSAMIRKSCLFIDKSTALRLTNIVILSGFVGAEGVLATTNQNHYFPADAFNRPQSQLTIEAGLNLQSAAAVKLKNNLSDEQTVQFKFLDSSDSVLGSSLSSRLNFQLSSLNSSGELLIAFPEAYVMSSDAASFAFGRKIVQTSTADQALGMGLINPTLTSDQITKTQQGIFGLHSRFQTGSTEAGNFGLSFLGQLAFLPSQSPGVKNSNSELVAANRWAPAPPTKARFNDELKTIDYTISDVDYAKIINQQGFLTEADWSGDAWGAKMSYGDLPLNDLAISRSIFTDLSINPKVTLVPVVLRHRVENFETFYVSKFSDSKLKTTLGFLSSTPEQKSAEVGFETQNPQSSVVASIVTKWEANQASSNIELLQIVELALAQVSGGEITDSKANGEPALFRLANSRFQFTRPVQIMVGSVWFDQARHSVSNETKFVYDLDQEGSLFDTKVSWSLKKFGLRLDAGLTVLGVVTVDDTKDDSDRLFLDKYSANDRVYGGLTYVF